MTTTKTATATLWQCQKCKKDLKEVGITENASGSMWDNYKHNKNENIWEWKNENYDRHHVDIECSNCGHSVTKEQGLMFEDSIF